MKKSELDRRKVSTENYVELSAVEEYAKLSVLKEEIEEYIEKYGEDAELIIYAYYENVNAQIKVERLENDEEYNTRIGYIKQREANAAAAKKKRQAPAQEVSLARKQDRKRIYEELKKEFEN